MEKPECDRNYLKYIEELNISTIEKEQKLWANDAYINYMNIEIEKIQNDVINLKTNITNLYESKKKSEEELKDANILRERVVNSLKIASSSLISMKEQERLAEEQYKTYKEKTEDTLIENKLEYEERKAALESRHPVYMQLKNAKIQLQKANIEEKTALQKMDDLKKIFRLRKEIERKFFNNSIVSFVSAIKKYHDNKDIYLKLKNAEKEEEKLIGILEEKLKKQSMKKKEVYKIQSVMLPQLSTDLMIPAIEMSSTTVSSSVVPKTISASVMSKYLSSKNKIQDFAARREERRKKLRDLENDDQSLQFINNHKKLIESPQVNIIQIQNVTPTSNYVQNLPQPHFVKPSTPKRFKTHKSPPFIDPQKHYPNIPIIEPKAPSQYPVNIEKKPLRYHSQLINIEKQIPLSLSKQIQQEVVVEKKLSQEQQSQQTSIVPNQNIVLKETNDQLALDTNLESNMSSKMRHWQNLTNFEMYNQMYNTSGDNGVVNVDIDMDTSSDDVFKESISYEREELESYSSQHQNYFTPSMLSPPHGMSNLATYQQFEADGVGSSGSTNEEETTNIVPQRFDLFKFNEQENQPFQFKGSKKFDMF